MKNSKTINKLLAIVCAWALFCASVFSGAITSYASDTDLEEMPDLPILNEANFGISPGNHGATSGTVTYEKINALSMTGGTSSSSESGTVYTFDGTAVWCELNFGEIAFSTELHLFVQNNSENKRIFQLNWRGADKVLNQNGVDVTSSIVSSGNTILPANDNSIYELVYYAASGHSPAQQINCVSVNDSNGSLNSVGSLTIKGYYIPAPQSPDLAKITATTTTGGSSTDTAEGTVYTFNETATWCDLNFESIKFSNELHLFVQNDSEYIRYCQLNWKPADKVLDANGNDVTTNIVLNGVTTLPANDNSVYELVYYAASGHSPAQQINCISLNDSNDPINSVGSLTIKGYYVPKISLSEIKTKKMTGASFADTEDGTVYTFNGTSAWCDLDIDTITITDELHLFVQNNSESRRFFLLNWGKADKVLNENGTDVTSTISNEITVLPANDNSVYELIYYSANHPTVNQINCTTVNASNVGVLSTGTVTVKGYYMPSQKTGSYAKITPISMSGGTSASTYYGTVFNFDGTAQWCDLSFNSINFSKELHLFVQNDSEYIRYCQLNWKPADKVLDANGNDVTTNIVLNGVTTLPANDASVYELVYYASEHSPAQLLNCISIHGGTNESVGSLIIKGYYVTGPTVYPLSSGSIANSCVSLNIVERPVSYDNGGVLIVGGLKFNHLNDGTIALSYTESGETLYDFGAITDALTVGSYNMSITTQIGDYDNDGNEDDVRFGVWFNGVLSGNRYYTAPDCANKLTNTIVLDKVATTDDEVYVKLEKLPKTYTTITPNDMGISDGVYIKEANTDWSHTYGALAEGETLDKKVLSVMISFSGTLPVLYYGGSDGWNGLMLYSNPNVENRLTLINSGDSCREGTSVIVFEDEIAGVSLINNTYNLKISTEWVNADNGSELNDLKIGVWFNNKLYNNSYIYYYNYTDVFNGNSLGLYRPNDDSCITISSEVGLKPDTTHNTTDIYYCVKEGPYLLSGNNMTVNGVTADSDLITTPGDYKIVRTKNSIGYEQNVYIWQTGDVHADGLTDVRDLVALKKNMAGIEIATKAGIKAVDLNKDGKVDSTDMVILRKAILGVEEIDTSVALKKLTYSSNGSDVMPIAGFYGPYASYQETDVNGDTYTAPSTLTEENYKLLSECGINLITTNHQRYGDTNEDNNAVFSMLEYAQKYGIDMYLIDAKMYNSKLYTADSATLKEFVKDNIKVYNNYSSFKGIFLRDEPVISGVYPNQNIISQIAGNDTWRDLTVPQAGEYYVKLSKLFAQFSNITPYINLLPYETNFGSESAYNNYIDWYVDNCSPKVISFDKYPFNKKTDSVSSASGYLKNLSLISNKAKEHNLPFWSCVQAGSNWNDNQEWMSPTENFLTEAKMKWNVNTSLAFGAKGIQYFPVVQPYYFSFTENGTYDYTRNGLIGADNSKTPWYNYAKNINRWISVVDDVLMNSTYHGMLATKGKYHKGYAYNCLTDAGVIALSSYDCVTGITVDGQNNYINANKYGAMAGCFDYYGKTALYVLNYDVDKSHNITLNLDSLKTLSITAPSGISNISASTVTISLGAGEAALVVID